MFRDRTEAGRQLAARLGHLRDEHPIVLGLPRGGVPVAAEVAAALQAPLDVLVVRKLGVPFQPELGMGAIGEDDVRVLNEAILRSTGVSEAELARVEQQERAELRRRARRYRGDRPPLALTGRTVIVVDDGLATGGTARAALHVARERGARRLVLAVPVAPPDTVQALAADADEIVCIVIPERLYAIGEWYEDFGQTEDTEVVALLERAHRAERAGSVPGSDRGSHPGRESLPVDREVEIPAAGRRLPGHLTIPSGAQGLVLFAHGSGSSRHSPRNRSVARTLEAQGLGTLLFDLLEPAEADDRSNVFDIDLLATRLLAATKWARAQSEVSDLAIGYFGASTGAGAALVAAAHPASGVGAVVSRGGRPDLAGGALDTVRAPTLLIVGGADTVVVGLNQEAAQRLRCLHRLEIVPGATHLFEEPGTLEAVAHLAADWFLEHLGESATKGAIDARTSR